AAMIVPAETHVGGLEAEHRLVIAVLRQAVVDVRSRNPATRAEAQRFFADRPLLEFWTSLVGLDSDAFRARMPRLLWEERMTAPPSFASAGGAQERPRQWEKWVLYAYLRMMGRTQKDAGSAVGRAKRTVAEWEADKITFAQAREEARQRWLGDVTDAARRGL